MMRTIKVTGKGKIAVKPDKIRLYVNKEELCHDMKILFANQQKIQSYSRIYLKNLDFREKILKQYILMLIQNMKAFRTGIIVGKAKIRGT